MRSLQSHPGRAAILATGDKDIEQRLIAFRKKQTESIPEEVPAE